MLRSVNILTIALAFIVAGGITFDAASARDSSARERVRIGTLDCSVAPGVGLIVASQKRMNCTFNPSYRGPRERYRGAVTKVGVDVGFTNGGAMAWAVYAPTTRGADALAGNYGGLSAEATVGLGAGANVLVGGSDRTVTLQPISVQGQSGLNLAAGIAGLELHPARPTHRFR